MVIPLVINRAPPFPNESLQSYLYHIGRINYYEELNWYEDLICIPRGTHVNYLYSDSYLSSFSKLLNINIRTLKDLTVQKFIPFFYTEEEINNLPGETTNQIPTPKWEESGRNKYLNGPNKICPLCYKENQKVLLPWLLRPITFCPTHKIHLIEKCSQCGNSLKINNGNCSYCGYNICNQQFQEFDNDLSIKFGLKIWTSINCQPFEEKSDCGINNLRELQSPLFFSYLWKMGQILFQHDPSNILFKNISLYNQLRPMKSLRQLSSKDLHWVLLASVNTLIDFPGRLIECIDRLVGIENNEKGKKNGDHSILHELKVSYKLSEWGWFWLPIIEYFSQINGKDRRILLMQKYVRKIDNELRENNKNEKTIKTIRRTNKDPNNSTEPANFLLIGEAIENLGISRKLLFRLIEAVYIEPEPSYLTNKRNKWQFDKVKIEDFIKDTLAQFPLIDLDASNSTKIVYLNKVCLNINYAQIKFEDFFQSLLSGSLSAYRAPYKKGLSAIWMYKEDIQRWKASFIQPQKAGLSIYEVMKKLGVGKETLRHLKNEGILIPLQTSLENINLWEYREEDVEIFSSSYILSEEVSNIIGISQHMVISWSKAGWIPAIVKPTSNGTHFYWYKKEEIIKWRKERITSAEAKSLLGIKQRTLEDWIAKGIIKPLENISQHPHWFSYSEVNALRNKN